MNLIKLGFNRDRAKDLVAGAGAGAAATFAVAPLDAIKDTQKQYQNLNRISKARFEAGEIPITKVTKHPEALRRVAKELWTSGKGVKGKAINFYRGTGTSILKIAPAAALQFMIYGLLKEKLQRKNS